MCKLRGCSNPTTTRGLCDLHYSRAHQAGDVKTLTKFSKKPLRMCQVTDCPRSAHVGGYCTLHYTRFRRHGDAEKTLKHPGYNGQTCRITGCNEIAYGRDLCRGHYGVIRNHGLDPAEFGEPPYTCALCGRIHSYWNPPDLTVDHIHPRARGGESSRTNLRLVCSECNVRKRASTDEELLEWCRKVIFFHS